MRKEFAITLIILIGLLIYSSPQISLYTQKIYNYFFIQKEVPEEKVQVAEERKEVDLIKEGSGIMIFDQSHENGFLAIGENGTYSHFSSVFLEAGYDLEVTRNESELEEKLSSGKILVITKPLQNYSAMKEKVVKFVSDGGVLILIGDVDKRAVSNLNELSLEFGVIFNNDYIYDLYNYSILYNNPIISDFEFHRITLHLKNFVVYKACSLKVFDKTLPLAYAGKNAKSTLEFQKLVVLAATKHGDGKVIGMCDGDLWTNELIEEFDNKNLLVSIINWIVVKED